MHELSIAQSILEIVRQHVPRPHPAQVETVKVRVGLVSGVVPESLEFCFGVMVQDTPLEGARLEIERVPLRSRCGDCDRTFVFDEAVFSCPECSGFPLEVLSGTELQVVEIALAEEPAGIP